MVQTDTSVLNPMLMEQTNFPGGANRLFYSIPILVVHTDTFLLVQIGFLTHFSCWWNKLRVCWLYKQAFLLNPHDVSTNRHFSGGADRLF